MANVRTTALYTTLFLILAGGLFLAGCNEDSIIRANVTPTSDALYVANTDTFTIDARTIRDDSVVTSSSISGLAIFHALGWVNADDYTGHLAGSIYCQFIPPTTGWQIPAGFDFDSVVLVLPYSGFSWGDTLTNFPNGDNVSYRAFRINQEFSKDSTFYAFSSLSTSGGDVSLPNTRFTGTLRDSVRVKGVNKAPHLRIPLNSAFRDELKAALASDTTYVSFLKTLQGLYVVPDTVGKTGRVMPYFFLNASSLPYGAASLQVYAHNATTAADTAYNFSFVPAPTGPTAHFNRISRTIASGSPAANIINAGQNDPLLLLHNEPGAAIELTFPNVQSLPQGIINRAEIVITKIPDANNRYFEPTRLYPLGLDAGGGAYNILDRFPLTSLTPLDFIDGRRRTVTLNGMETGEYRINIPRELQHALNTGQQTLRLRINGAQTYPGAYRLVAGGGSKSGSQYRIRLNLVYTRQQP